MLHRTGRAYSLKPAKSIRAFGVPRCNTIRSPLNPTSLTPNQSMTTPLLCHHVPKKRERSCNARQPSSPRALPPNNITARAHNDLINSHTDALAQAARREFLPRAILTSKPSYAEIFCTWQHTINVGNVDVLESNYVLHVGAQPRYAVPLLP